MPDLSQKLGAKPGAEVLVFFTTRRAELERRFPALKATLAPADDNGLVDNKSAAIDERWQALRFVYRVRER